MRILKYTPLMLLFLVLTGCASLGQRADDRPADSRSAAAESHSFFPFSLFDDEDEEDEVGFTPKTTVVDERPFDDFDGTHSLVHHREEVRGLLYSQLKEWRSVRYEIGGMSKHGIDCSGFVYLTYRDKFGIELPRNTTYQVRAGEVIRQDELKPGDLVFFQVSRSTRHVGIYLEDRKFMHASSKLGVTVSSLDSAYWSKRYWKAVRVEAENGG